MNISSNIYRKVRNGLAMVVILATTASCSWISDDLEPCPTGLHLRFVYDYNMMRSDVFRDHVGEVTAYVFGADGKLVTMQTENNPSALGTYGYEMAFDELVPGDYRVVALAFQRDAAGRQQRAGAKFRYPQMTVGDPVEKLKVKLDRTGQADGTQAVEHQAMPLDTLWMNYREHRVTVTDQQVTNETVGLMRDTKNLTVTLRQVDRPAEVDYRDFDIRITDHNGFLGCDNMLLPDDLLTYTPYTAWNTEFCDDEGHVVQRAAHADLSFSRLMYHDDWRQNARLTIVNKKNGSIVADINLPDYLAQGRSSLEQNYSPQEFLDREFVYKLDFFLKGDTWEFVELSISVLNWSVRIQNVEL